MITNTGKKIIAKFLLNQAPDYATHIAAGCGPIALSPAQTISAGKENEIKAKTNLDFEMFRVPIIAKGFVKENGVEKIVLKAEMPTDQRYQITEVGFFSAGANALAGSFDSKTLSTFSPTESWIILSGTSSSTITTLTSNASISDGSGNIITTDKANFIISDASTFSQTNRKDRQESPRFYNRALMVSGDSSYIDANYNQYGYKIENSTLAFNLSENLPEDEIRMAVSIISTQASNNTAPPTVRFTLEFINNIPGLTTLVPKAKTTMQLLSSDFIDPESSNINRYYVFKKKLSSFQLDDGFSWANVNLIRLYASAIDERTHNISSISTNSTTATLTLAESHSLYAGMTFDIESLPSPYNVYNGTNLIVTSSTGNTITYQHNTASAATMSASVTAGLVRYDGGIPSYKIIFDGMRLENNSIENPLYSLVGYDLIRESSAYPVLKTENTNNYIEYRFGIGVDSG